MKYTKKDNKKHKPKTHKNDPIENRRNMLKKEEETLH